MNSSNDYVPPGLGRTLEDLIEKHASKLSSETPYQWAIRTANKTRSILSNSNNKPLANLPPEKLTGKTAYEWGLANGKSTTEVARLLGISVYSIKAHQAYYKLPPLSDGRVNSKDRKRVRRDPKTIELICKTAYSELKQTGQTKTAICRKHRLDSKTLQSYIFRNLKRK